MLVYKVEVDDIAQRQSTLIIGGSSSVIDRDQNMYLVWIAWSMGEGEAS